MKANLFLAILILAFTANTLYSKEPDQIITMDQLEAVIRNTIKKPPYYPRNPTHIQVELPNRFSLEELRLRIPDSPLPIISAKDVKKIGADYGGCYLKSTGEQIYPIQLSIRINGFMDKKPPERNLGNDTVVLWYTLADVCEVGDGSGGWVYLQKKEGKWVVVKQKKVMEFD